MAQRVKNLPAIPGSGRFSGGENGNPRQYPHLKNLMDRGAMGLQRIRYDYAQTPAYGQKYLSLPPTE